MAVMNIDTNAKGPTHEEVLETTKSSRAEKMQKLVRDIVSKITLTS